MPKPHAIPFRRACTARRLATMVAAAILVAPPTARAADPAMIGDFALRHAEAMARSSSRNVCGQSPGREAAGIAAALLFGGVIFALPVARAAKKLDDAATGWRQCYGAVVELNDGTATLLTNFDSDRAAAAAMQRLSTRRVLAVFNDQTYRCGAVVRSSRGHDRLFAGVGATASAAAKEAVEACRVVAGEAGSCSVVIRGDCNRWR